MSTGSSILLVFFLCVIGYGIYLISKKNKWRTIGKIFLYAAIAAVFISTAIWVYLWYEDLPYEAEKLGKVSLNMSTVEAKLLLGEPTRKSEEDEGNAIWVYKPSYTLDYFLSFEDGTLKWACSRDYSKKLFGLGVYTSEEKVVKRLGPPEKTSIFKDGTMKHISWDKYNASFEIEKGSVISVCIMRHSGMTYKEEYSD